MTLFFNVPELWGVLKQKGREGKKGEEEGRKKERNGAANSLQIE